MSDRLTDQLRFLLEADKLKLVLRQTPLVDLSRRENSAEHTWHMVLIAMVAREYACEPIDLLHAIQLIAVHDLVEIDAGDTFAYDVGGQETRAVREQAAAARIFGLLPEDQAATFQSLWEEFEAHVTPESRFANAVDRLQPFLLNANCGGGSWATHGVNRSQILRRMAPIESALPTVWPLVTMLIEQFCVTGVIRDDRD